jgi:pimeloyl-ACP methyl ester carboxylesterase
MEIGLPVAEALAAAHRRGIVHRDIKPGNVLLAETGTVKLVDFGLAKLRESGEKLTQTGAVIGTVAYMSPEQVLGEAVGAPSDVFSWGVLAYELLSGQSPFKGKSAAVTLYQIANEPHRPLRDVRNDLPEGLIAIVEACLEKQQHRRLQNGGELVAELRKFCQKNGSEMEKTVSARIDTWGRSSPVLAQEIRFCTTGDGVNIAYSIVGEGPPLVRVLGWFTHLEMEWQWPGLRFLWQKLAEQLSVIRYDGRGFGLSDPYDGEFSEETRRLDLDAVMKAAEVEKATLLGISEGGWTAADYALRYPERVARLVLYGSYARGATARPDYDPEEDQAMTTLIRKAWGRDDPAFRQLYTVQFFGRNASPELIAHFNELQRAAAKPETAARYVASNHSRGDGSRMFSNLRTPTLVVHRRDSRVVKFEEGRYLAAQIPNAKFLPLAGGDHYFPSNQAETMELVEAIHRFAATAGQDARTGSGPVL